MYVLYQFVKNISKRKGCYTKFQSFKFFYKHNIVFAIAKTMKQIDIPALYVSNGIESVHFVDKRGRAELQLMLTLKVMGKI